ncbi:hypothetical protein BGZ60DRAFT_434967 [Tricladium varicosporioides]|nr:hypothetical protein BGZ60DRAFT_434967 [Hymenoscyphus varicosporioides]
MSAFGQTGIYSTTLDKDGLHHLRQILLRSGLPSSAVFWHLIEMAWSWRRSTTNSMKRSLPVIVVATLHMNLLFVASIFSSRVAHVNEIVLIRPSLCGWIVSPLASVSNRIPGQVTQEALESSNALAVATRWSYTQSLQYSRNCYQNTSAFTLDQCNKYIVPRLKSRVNREAPCPFKEGVCTTAAFEIDSELIDSHIHLGINAYPGDRLQLRKVTSCAPFPLEEKYSSDWTNGSYGEPPGMFHRYYYIGPGFDQNDTINFSTLPFTFQITAYNITTLPGSGVYNAFFFVFSPGNLTESTFQPIEDFYRDDADVNILSLVNSVAYTGEVTDPLFKAWISGEMVPGPGQYWISNRTLSGLGCVEQYQFCSSKSCTNLVGYYQLNDSIIQSLNLNKRQSATFKLLQQALWASRIRAMDTFLAGDWLLAKDKLYGNILLSSPLEENHWQMEVANIHNVTLALLQRRIVEHALPPPQNWPLAGVNKYISPPELPDEKQLCKIQMIHSSNYKSFSAFGVAFIIFGGLFLIGLNYSLPLILNRSWLGMGENRYRRDHWIIDSMFQVHRLAAEGRGVEPWNGKYDDVPVTREYAKKYHLGNRKDCELPPNPVTLAPASSSIHGALEISSQNSEQIIEEGGQEMDEEVISARNSNQHRATDIADK